MFYIENKTAAVCACGRALVAIGCFTILSSAVGYFGSQFRPVFLSLYLIAGTFATTLQLMLVLGIFAAQEKVADEIEKADSITGVKHFDKWVLPFLTTPNLLHQDCTAGQIWAVLHEHRICAAKDVLRTSVDLASC